MRIAVDGRAVHVATGGQPADPERPALVFVHGAGMDHTVWQQQARALAHRGFAVLAVDLPGHGGSEGPPLDGIGAIADWLTRLIATAGFAQAALIGHSMGALAALEAAARHPEQISALALLGVAAKMPVHPALLEAARHRPDEAAAMIVGWGHAPRARIGGNVAPGIWLTGAGLRLLQRAAPNVLAADLASCDAYAGATEAAARVRCPVLLLLGAQDRMTPAKAARPLRDAIAGAAEIVLPDAGHMMMVEAPDATRTALQRFVETTMGRSEAS